MFCAIEVAVGVGVAMDVAVGVGEWVGVGVARGVAVGVGVGSVPSAINQGTAVVSVLKKFISMFAT